MNETVGKISLNLVQNIQTKIHCKPQSQISIIQTGAYYGAATKHRITFLYLCKNLLLRFKEQIRMIDTPQLHEKTVHFKKKSVYYLIRIIYSRL